MNNDEHLGTSKTHPASREMLPDDPLSLDAFEVSGDVDLMMRLLVEDYARMGWGAEAILSLARDPFYQAFHGLYRRYGEDEFGRRLREILSRVGVTRVKAVESARPPAEVVEIQLPASAPRRDDYA